MGPNVPGSRGSGRQHAATDSGGSAPAFGGSWTQQKLDVLAMYLTAYTTALKNQRFQLLYIDAFAGTGSWQPRWTKGRSNPTLFDADDRWYRDGSARIALETQPGFDRYVFIERSRRKADALASLKSDHRSVGARTEVIQDDANNAIPKLCAEDWRSQRGVIFIDPFGMEVRWGTLEAIARTEALDMWLLFPLGAMNRLLTKTGVIDGHSAKALDQTLGTNEWRSAMYSTPGDQLTLEGSVPIKAKRDTAALWQFAKRRLETIFHGGVDHPAILRNSRNSPLFAFFFAVSNPHPRACGLAHKIAAHILDHISTTGEQG